MDSFFTILTWNLLKWTPLIALVTPPKFPFSHHLDLRPISSCALSVSRTRLCFRWLRPRRPRKRGEGNCRCPADRCPVINFHCLDHFFARGDPCDGPLVHSTSEGGPRCLRSDADVKSYSGIAYLTVTHRVQFLGPEQDQTLLEEILSWQKVWDRFHVYRSNPLSPIPYPRSNI